MLEILGLGILKSNLQCEEREQIYSALGSLNDKTLDVNDVSLSLKAKTHFHVRM